MSVSPLYQSAPLAAPASSVATAEAPAVVAKAKAPVMRSGCQGGVQRAGSSGGRDREYYRGYCAAKGQGKCQLTRYVRLHGPPPTRGGTPWHGPAMEDRAAKGKAKGKGKW